MNITGTRTAERFIGMSSSIDSLESFLHAGTNVELLHQLEELKTLIENDKELARHIKNPSSMINQPYHIREAITAYAQILWAIAECKGYNYTQQLKDHGDLILGWQKGLYWQKLENPGNYASDILNTASRVMQEAYQNVRDVLPKEFRQIHLAVEKLKQQSGFSKFKEYTYGNQATIYKNIVYKTDDGDLMVRNPWKDNLTPAE